MNRVRRSSDTNPEVRGGGGEYYVRCYPNAQSSRRIHKPWNLNCGGGIKIVSNIARFKKEMKYLKQDSEWIKRGKQFYSEYFTGLCLKSVIQKYISPPLLIHKKKFDIRCYLLIACCDPFVVFFHHGYLRLSMQDYTIGNRLLEQQCTHAIAA